MRILLIDDHALFAKSLEIALEGLPEIERFQTLSDVSEAVDRIEADIPDILLIDINLNNISSEDGLVLAKKILWRLPDAVIVILTGYDLPVYRYEARKIGAKGFINKNTEPQKLVEILLRIHGGELYFPSTASFIEELTDSEKQILQMLSTGCKRKDIADTLYISERTVSNHLQHIFDKLGVSSSLEAVTRGIQLGYIQPVFG
ncbi:response regulator [Paenibacillus sp. 22594]|uniref:response regulator n=1 Tax=Paenibacillus sp. 22594 TaxID=3453947 RepID=UPI003F86CB86